MEEARGYKIVCREDENTLTSLTKQWSILDRFDFYNEISPDVKYIKGTWVWRIKGHGPLAVFHNIGLARDFYRHDKSSGYKQWELWKIRYVPVTNLAGIWWKVPIDHYDEEKPYSRQLFKKEYLPTGTKLAMCVKLTKQLETRKGRK